MIKLKNIGFSYGRQRVLDGLSLEVGKGEAVLITGINGTGKTTLLRVMAGVLLPQSGTVEFSEDLGNDPRQKIGFISDRMKLYEDMTLSRAIEFHCSNFGLEVAQYDMSLLEKTKLTLDKRVEDLSVGQRAIFHLSLILSTEPELLLIDEVIHSIDAYLREMFLDTLVDVMVKRTVTLVMVNLNYHDIEKLPQRVVLLKDGKVAVDETMDDLKRKVKKVVSQEDPGELPVLFSREWGGSTEYYIYPYDESAGQSIAGEVSDLNLNDIIKAFIGGEYV